MNDNLFAANSISIAIGKSVLMEKVNIALRPCDSLALCGPSGCGKTTLLRALAGLSDLAAGSIALRNRQPGEFGWPAYRRRVLYIPQRPVMFDATVAENLSRPFFYKNAISTFDPGKAKVLLNRLNIEPERFQQSARSLSEGQQQRVALARGMLLQPDVYLLDEPSSALDPESVAAVESAINDDIRARGCAAIIVSHDRAQAQRWGSSILDLSAHMKFISPNAGGESR